MKDSLPTSLSLSLSLSLPCSSSKSANAGGRTARLLCSQSSPLPLLPFRVLLVIAFCLAISLSLQLPSTLADFYQWENELITKDDPKGRGPIDMYKQSDSPIPFWSRSGLEESYINLNLKFNTADDEPHTGTIEVFILRTIKGDEVGHVTRDENGKIIRSFCCSPELVKQQICKEENINRLIVNGDVAGEHFLAHFKEEKTAELPPNSKHVISVTGEHLLVISDCNPQSADGKEGFPKGILVNGRTEWKNPYGYLSGRLYGYLPFYALMSLLFLVVGLIWLVLSLTYRQEIAAVQHCISFVLGLCLVECGVWFLDYLNWNETGVRHMGVIILAILLTVCRLSVSRMLVVAVSLGWGVVRPSLGKNKWKLIVLGLIYFVFESALEIVTRYSQSNTVADQWRIGLIVPVSILNSVFYWWMFLSLHRLLEYLDARKQTAKLQVYRQFTAVLIASLILAVIYALYQIYFTTTHQQMLHWSNLWLLDQGIPLMIYTIILLAIALLWRPSPSSKRYAYSQLGSESEQIEEDPDADDFTANSQSNNNQIEMGTGNGNGNGTHTGNHQNGTANGGGNAERTLLNVNGSENAKFSIEDEDTDLKIKNKVSAARAAHSASGKSNPAHTHH